MSEEKTSRPKARLPRGFRDRRAPEIAAERAFIDTIRRVYESYGFEPLETPAFEYTDALGKFLPDVDRPNEGVFSLKDDDGQWLSLRYDLTAPLARFVAENFQNLPKPFRRYQVGPVWRNEKPGPGRYREFTQFDADTVGSNSPSADAELLMMTCDTLEALGLKRGEYVVKLNSRKLLDGLLEGVGISLGDSVRRGIVLRALDKLDRLGAHGVRELLGPGRKDESGDFTKGANLDSEQIVRIIASMTIDQVVDDESRLASIVNWFKGDLAAAGTSELKQIISIIVSRGYHDRVQFDPGVVRGLDYYTGAVFEAQLTFPVTNEAGESVVFGSVAGGGRYDDLVARFTGQQVPATGISIGVSRLMNALKERTAAVFTPLVIVLALDNLENSFAAAAELRRAGIRTETYVGNKKFGDQLKYADRRGAAIAVIEGSDERANGKVTLKDLALGMELAKSIENRAAWVADRPAQKAVDRTQLVEEVRVMLAGESLTAMAAFPTYDAQRLQALNAQADAILSVFVAHGYDRVETSVLQPAEIFLDRAGEEIRHRTFVLTDPAGQDLCLRPDLTIPTCRTHLAQDGKFPARLCYNGLAFRHQPAEPERPTQFFQAGAELLGLEDRAAAETEILTLTVEALHAAGLDAFEMKLGDLALFGAFIDALDIAPQWRDRLKRHFWRAGYFEALLQTLSQGQPTDSQRLLAHLGTLDEFEARPAFEGLMDMLGGTPLGGRSREEIVDRLIEQAAEAATLRLDPNLAQLIANLLAVAGPAAEALSQIRSLTQSAGVRLDKPLGAMAARLQTLKDLGVAPDRVTFAARFGRNMEYYTGFVYESWSRDLEGAVQVAGGGRYDTLLENLGARRPTPAVGFTIRTERVLAARQMQKTQAR